MPAIYWLPLPAMGGPAAVEHLHAAFSAWFDEPDAHHDRVKPYRLAPLSRRGEVWGMEVSLLTDEALLALAARVDQGEPVRVGRKRSPVGNPIVLQAESWSELIQWPGDNAWRVEFLTPFAARTGNRTSPFPAPAVFLRAATESWAQFSGHTPIRVTPADQAHLWVSHLEVSTTTFTLNGHRHPGALGSVVYRADTPEVAKVASSLFRLAAYCGAGSFRGKGMGIVSVDSV